MKNTDIAQTVNDLVLAANQLADEIRNLRFENARLKGGNRKRLSKRDLALLHTMKSDGFSQAQIAKVLDCNPATVSRNVRGIYNR